MEAADTLHLQRRGETWHFYRRVPTSLVAVLGRRFVKKSLGVTSLAEARKLRAIEEVRTNALFAQAETCHRNMLSRGKTRGAVIDPEFREFRSFLRHVGPMPATGATLDRINNEDRTYGPGLVGWADKRTQNGNKGDSLVFFCSRTRQSSARAYRFDQTMSESRAT